MSALTIRRSVSVEEISEPETNGGAPLLLYSNYLLIPADEPDVAMPAGKAVRLMVVLDRPTRATPLLFSADAASTLSSVLGKRRMLSEEGEANGPSPPHDDGLRALGSNLPRRVLFLLRPWASGRGSTLSQLEPPSSTASPVPVQSPMSMPGSSHQPCRSPLATFISGLNPRPAGDFGDPPDTLLGYGALLTPPFMTVLPVRLQDTPVRDVGECQHFVSMYTLNKLYHCVRVQSVRSSIRKGCPAATRTDSLFAKQFTYLSPARLVKIATSHHFHVHCPTIKRESGGRLPLAMRYGGTGRKGGIYLRI
ncbi:hypothetical protein K438DRAFT_1753409 [Mycena galopus ATCC 62051]|nr:hypothetical protein K438DRAFT_1753409 [Mycena galopus ATCC 62051]